MTYEGALNIAWLKLLEFKNQESFEVKFLADEYTVNLPRKSIISLSCNVPAKEYLAILVLHYLIKKIEGLPKPTNSWISFQELDGGKGYYPTFQKRALEPIVRKYAKNPEGLLTLIERFSAKRIQIGDIGIELEVTPEIPVLITFWKQDEEFSAQANILFDANIKEIFPTEDIVVLSEFIAKNV